MSPEYYYMFNMCQISQYYNILQDGFIIEVESPIDESRRRGPPNKCKD